MRHLPSLPFTALFLLLLGSQAQAQPDSLWSRTYAWRDCQLGSGIYPATAGGYVVSGESGFNWNADSQRFEDRQPFLLRISEEGDSLWTATFPSARDVWGVSDVVESSSGSFVFSYNSSDSAHLVTSHIECVNSHGETNWTWEYGPTDHDFLRPEAMLKSDRNNILSIIGIPVHEGEEITTRLAVMELSEDGDSLSTTFLDSCNLVGCRAIRLRDGSIVLLGGHMDWTTGIGDMIIMKYDQNYRYQWETTLNTNRLEDLRDVSEALNGELWALGCLVERLKSSTFLLRLSSAGELIERYDYAHDGGCVPYDLLTRQEDGIWITGTASGLPWLMQADWAGQRISEGSYSFGDTPFCSFYAMCSSPSNGLTITGDRYTEEEHERQGVWVVKMTTGVERVDRSEPHPPVGFLINAAFPSPFNSSTFVNFSTPYTGTIRASLVDGNGRTWTRWTENMTRPGEGRLRVDAGTLGSGLYFLRLEQNGREATTRLVLVR